MNRPKSQNLQVGMRGSDGDVGDGLLESVQDDPKHFGQPIVTMFSDIYKPPTLRHGCSVIKVLRCIPTDTVYIDKIKSMYNDVLRPLWMSLCHENIVPVIGIYSNNHPLPSIEVPYYENGNIMDYRKRWPAADRYIQITQIAAGISYLHTNDIIHGNICPTNILVTNDGRACVSDTAFNILMRQVTYDNHTPTPVTWRYKSPEELVNAAPMGAGADVYSWACVVYEVFSGERPYHDYYVLRGIYEIIRVGHSTLKRPGEMSPKLWSIMQQCWRPNAEDRPTMSQVEFALHAL